MFNLTDNRNRFAQDAAMLTSLGIHLGPDVAFYTPQEFKLNLPLAMDSAPELSTTSPNSSVPAILTTMIDPTIIEVLFSPNAATDIYSEVKKGDWTQDTIMFTLVENTGEVSSYGDYNNNGRAGANTNWPQRQQYLYQVVKEYGERELDRAGLAKINWVSQIDKAAAMVMNKFQNLTYFYGVQLLENYGILNDPSLSAALSPAPKSYGGVKWINNGVVVATANEIYADIQSLYLQLVNQTQGLIDQKTKMTLALSPGSEVALTATNSFNVNVSDLLKKNFPNITVVTAVQFGQLTTANPQGIAGGNMVQLIADGIEGQQTGITSYGEKLRAHAILKELSAFKQKQSGGTWGAVIFMPMAVASMLGV